METLKKLTWVIVLVLLVAVVYAIIQSEKAKKAMNGSDKVCYSLPTDGSMAEIGPSYWFALHDVVSRIPCSICNNEATGFMRFFHDYVNIKTGKPVYDQANYDAWIVKLNDQKNMLASLGSGSGTGTTTTTGSGSGTSGSDSISGGSIVGTGSLLGTGTIGH